MTSTIRFRNALLAAASLIALASSAWAAPAYRVDVLPLPLPQGFDSEGVAINANGTAAVQLYHPTGYGDAHRCSTVACELIPTGGDFQFNHAALARGINDLGFVVGVSQDGDNRRAFLFDGVNVKSLGAFNEGPCGGCNLASYANGINHAAQIVGSGTTSEGKFRGFIWENGEMTKLGTLGGDESFAVAINDNGDVVGGSTTADGREHAFIYWAGKMGDLGTLGGTWARANAINQTRQVVGCSGTKGDAEGRAFIHSNGVMKPLPALGGTYACAKGINRGGWVVGNSALVPGDWYTHGFVFDGSNVYDLNDTLGEKDRAEWEVMDARGINKNRQIVATAWNRSDGVPRAVVLTPIAR